VDYQSLSIIYETNLITPELSFRTSEKGRLGHKVKANITKAEGKKIKTSFGFFLHFLPFSFGFLFDFTQTIIIIIFSLSSDDVTNIIQN
jgi:hypothetical protein